MSNKENASARALRLLNDRLRKGNFADGTRMPPERQLATELNVSRRALRDALGHLEAEGKIWRGVGQGTFIGRRPLDSITSLADIKQLTTPPELMDARLALEPPIAAMASSRAATRDLDEAWRCLKKSAGVSSALAWEQWDSAFHMAIAHAAHNKLISALLDTLQSVRTHNDWGRLRQASLTPERQLLYTNQHRAILAAISDRDANGAAQAMQTHLLTVKETLLSNWEEQIPTTRNIF